MDLLQRQHNIDLLDRKYYGLSDDDSFKALISSYESELNFAKDKIDSAESELDQAHTKITELQDGIRKFKTEVDLLEALL